MCDTRAAWYYSCGTACAHALCNMTGFGRLKIEPQTPPPLTASAERRWSAVQGFEIQCGERPFPRTFDMLHGCCFLGAGRFAILPKLHKSHHTRYLGGWNPQPRHAWYICQWGTAEAGERQKHVQGIDRSLAL